MKNYKMLKRYGAALTAVAMLGVSGLAVSAADPEEAEDVPAVEDAVVEDEPTVPQVDAAEEPAVDAEVEAPAEDVESEPEADADVDADVEEEEDAPVLDEDADADADADEDAEPEKEVVEKDVDLKGSDLDADWNTGNTVITTGTPVVTYTLKPDQEDDVIANRVYTVKIPYEITDGDSSTLVTMLGYLFGAGSTGNAEGTTKDDGTNVPSLVSGSESADIRAVDQVAYTAHAVSQAVDGKNHVASFKLDAQAMTITETSTLVVKMGCSIGDAQHAQAVLIELEGAEKSTEPEVPEGTYGDLTGDDTVDTDDVYFILKYMVSVPGYELEEGSPEYTLADVYKDGAVDTDDCYAILKHMVSVPGYVELPYVPGD